MADTLLKQQRGVTRTKLTKVLQKAGKALDTGDRSELEALKKIISDLKESLQKLDLEISGVSEETDEDIEKTLAYQFEAQLGIEKMNKTLTVPQNSAKNDIQELFREQNQITRMLALNQERSLLPKREPDTFDGTDLLKYRPFMQSFQHLIASKTDSDSERLYYLEQFTKGIPRELIRGCLQMEPSDGYIEALTLLEKRYGNEFAIADAYIQQLEAWPQIRQEDGKALEAFAVFLTSCGHYVANTTSLNHLQSPKEIHAIIMKLPYKVRERWRAQACNILDKGKDIKFQDLVEFVNSQSRLVNMPVFGDIKDHRSTQNETGLKPQHKPVDKMKRSTLMATMMDDRKSSLDKSTRQTGEVSYRCPCKESNHVLSSCSAFAEMPYEEKRNFVMKNALCFGCLRVGHRSKDCTRRLSCEICQKKHPTVFHIEKPERKEHQTPKSEDKNKVLESKNLHTGAGGSKKVALALIPVKVTSASCNSSVTTYAALDNFSSDCFVSNKLLETLGVQGTPTEIKLTTMEKKNSSMLTRAVSGLEVFDLDENEKISLPVVYSKTELPIGRDDIPGRSDVDAFPFLNEVPFQYVDADVGLLIGINVPEALRPLEIVDNAPNEPYASRHRLGWALNGPLSGQKKVTHVHRTKVEDCGTLEDKLQHMWNHDYKDNSANEKCMSLEDKQWEKKVSATTTLREGHYEVPLPFREDDIRFPENCEQALQRLELTKKRLIANDDFRNEYSQFMSLMIEKGYMERVPENELRRPNGKVWYITHHAVFHKEKKSIRVVFDCSLKSHGVSLNDKLLQGPDLTNNLLGVLLRFRQGNITLIGDLEKMFYQVKVPKDQVDFLRLWWFPDGDIEKTPDEYRLTVHVFGAVSSPSCANYALRRTALDHQEEFGNEVTETIQRRFYVDDMVTSLDDEESAMKLLHDVREVCQRGGFNLTKISSNSPEVRNSIPLEHRATDSQMIDLSQKEVPFQRALGVILDLTTDSLGYKINVSTKPVTKRGILSTIFSIYDPFGFVGPAILPAKRIFQEACRCQLDWDEELPEVLRIGWETWIKELSLLSEYRVSRCYRPKTFIGANCELHLFCDASESGYGAVAYLKFSGNGQIHCSIVMAKCRLAPMKKITIPRMELTAAKLAVSIKVVLNLELDIKIDAFFYWTDSTAVLRYINNSSKRFQRFVANRLQYIHENSEPHQWRYVKSETNPADHASRGLKIHDFVRLDEWKFGPNFLWSGNSCEHEPEEFDELNVLDPNDPEIKVPRIKSFPTKTDNDTLNTLLNSTSSWYQFKKRVAWLLKIKESLRTKTKLELSLSVTDLEKAEHTIFEHIQRTSFAQEFADIPNGQVQKNSPLRKLNPMIDDQGVIRVGGRISQSSLTWAMKHPIILPKGHRVSEMIIQEQHRKSGCMGKNMVLASVREKFWIIGANQLIRKVVSSCLFCRKRKGKAGQQLMASLPPDRIEGDLPPFTNVGVDYFGPFSVTNGRKSEKRYGVIFTCLSSRAIHLEMAHSLDTSSCINALRRFIARRGQVKIMRSDNGTNFIGAEKELKEGIRKWNQQIISKAMLQNEVQWIFNPPLASHFGGAWEREIRSIRNVLNGVLNMQPIRVNGDELNTLLCEVESILNSRPLTPVSDDPNDLEPLTPNHILLVKSGPTFPPGLFSSSDHYVKRRWRQVQYLVDVFWSRWKKEYLSNLQSRQKWNQNLPSHSVGDLVLLMDQNLPRNQWSVGRIIKTFPDDCGKVRSVTVRTVNIKTHLGRTSLINCKPSFSDFERPIHKIVLLKAVNEM